MKEQNTLDLNDNFGLFLNIKLRYWDTCCLLVIVQTDHITRFWPKLHLYNEPGHWFQWRTRNWHDGGTFYIWNGDLIVIYFRINCILTTTVNLRIVVELTWQYSTDGVTQLEVGSKVNKSNAMVRIIFKNLWEAFFVILSILHLHTTIASCLLSLQLQFPI